jgi:2-hydroxymuconate-semialdehyde hydrolase
MAYRNQPFDYQTIPVHVIEGGNGLPVLMIHGSGPGASTIGNWRRVLDPMAERFQVHAMDLIGFGQSGRKPQAPYFDIDFWLGQCRAAIARMPGQEIGIVGHSISAALALKLAATEKRIVAVLTTGAMGARFTVNDGTIRCWTFPANRAELRRTAETLIFDHSLIDDTYLTARETILHEDPSYAPYFAAMFEGDKQKFADAAILTSDELAAIKCRVTMLHGRDDTAFPPATTLALAAHLPQADVQLIARCSHSVAMEHPANFVAAANLLFC